MELSPENPLSADPEIETTHVEEFVEQLRCVTSSLPSRINIDAQSVEQGLAKLVLTLIEFIRRLLEKQAVRHMEGGDLSPEQIEELRIGAYDIRSQTSGTKGKIWSGG